MSRSADTGTTRKNHFVAAGLAVVLGALGFLAGRVTAPEDRRHSVTLPAPSPSAPGSGDAKELDAGFARTTEGAVHAATYFARLTSTVSGDSRSFVETAVDAAAPNWKSEARRLAENGVDFIVEQYGPGGSSTFVPVRYRIASFSQDRATVAVWGVTLAMGAPSGGIDESWVTGTFDLAWVRGDWRIAGGDSDVGPTPRLLQTENPLPVSGLTRFEEYSGVPRP